MIPCWVDHARLPKARFRWTSQIPTSPWARRSCGTYLDPRARDARVHRLSCGHRRVHLAGRECAEAVDRLGELVTTRAAQPNEAHDLAGADPQVDALEGSLAETPCRRSRFGPTLLEFEPDARRGPDIGVTDHQPRGVRTLACATGIVRTCCPSRITVTRSHRSRTSASRWETKMTPTPRALSRSITARSVSKSSWVRLDVGSSRTSDPGASCERASDLGELLLGRPQLGDRRIRGRRSSRAHRRIFA